MGLLEVETLLAIWAELLLFEVDLLEELLVLVELDRAELTRVGVAAMALQTWETAGAASGAKGLPLLVGLQ